MGLSANAARMNVERSLDQLRAGLARRGITSTATAVAAALEASAASAAPAHLSGTVAAEVLSQVGAAALAGSGATLLVMSKVTTACAAAGAAALIGAGIYYAQRTASLARETEAFSRSTLAPSDRASSLPTGGAKARALPAATKPVAAHPIDLTDFSTPWVQQEMAENPEFRGALGHALDAQFRRTRAPLFRDLHLTAEQIQRWSALNLQRASDWQDVAEAARRDGADAPAADAMRNQVMATYDTALAGIIGADHVAAADQFERNYPAENLVDHLVANSARTAAPLSSAQADALLQAMTSQHVPNASGTLDLNLNALNWDQVTAQAQAFLSADQLALFQALRAANATRGLRDEYDASR